MVLSPLSSIRLILSDPNVLISSFTTDSTFFTHLAADIETRAVFTLYAGPVPITRYVLPTALVIAFDMVSASDMSIKTGVFLVS